MKKTLVGVMTLFGLLAFNQNAMAQFEKESLSFGTGLGYTGYTKGVGSNLTINLRGNYNIDEKNAGVFGYNLVLPITTSYTSTAHASSSSTTPSSVDVKIDQKVTINNIFLNYHRYLIADNEETFGMYGLVGVGLTFASVSYAVGSYNSGYSFGRTDAFQDETYTGFIIDFGLGANYNISDKVAVFGEFKIGLPATNTSTSTGSGSGTTTELENPIPFNYSIGLGVRYSMFN